MKKYIILLTTTILLFGCNSNTVKDDEFILTGQLDNADKVIVTLQEIMPNNVVTVDSVITTNNGEFSFRRKMPYQSLYVVALDNINYITILPNFKENILLTGNYNAFSKTYTIDGSPESTLLWELNKKNLDGISVVASLANTWDETRAGNKDLAPIKDSLDKIYASALEEQRQFTLDFIDKNAGSLVALIGIYKTFNGNELLNSKNDFYIYEKVAEEMRKKIPENPHVIKFVNHVADMKEKIATASANPQQ